MAWRTIFEIHCISENFLIRTPGGIYGVAAVTGFWLNQTSVSTIYTTPDSGTTAWLLPGSQAGYVQHVQYIPELYCAMTNRPKTMATTFRYQNPH